MLCNRARDLIEKFDWLHHIRHVDIYDHDTVSTLPFSLPDESELVTEVHLIDKNGHIYRGFAAVRKILGCLPVTAVFSVFLYIPGIPLLGNIVYRYIAKNRKRHQTSTH